MKTVIFALITSLYLVGSAQAKDCHLQTSERLCEALPHGSFCFMENLQLEGEIWKNIVGWEGTYQVSNLGRIRSLDRLVFINHGNGYYRVLKGAAMKYQIGVLGYPIILLQKNGFKYMANIHTLVGKAFIPNPKNKPTINHKFGIKTDNRATQLEWATQQEQVIHSYQVLGRKQPKGGDNSKSIAIFQYFLNGALCMKHGSITEASEFTGFAYSTIQRKAIKGAIWRGYMWSYSEVKRIGQCAT